MKDVVEKTIRQKRREFLQSEIERLKEEIEGYRREKEITKQLCMMFKAEIKKACEKYGIPEPDLGEDPEDLD